MKKILLAIVSVGILIFIGYWGVEMYRSTVETKNNAVVPENFKIEQKIQNGDIIFQTSKSNQSKAIQLATNSKYSHMGMIYENDGKYFVYEAVQPVKQTPLSKWIDRGKDNHYVIKRLRNASKILTNSTIKNMKKIGSQYNGKSYDLYFEWSDDKMYCSELVWKIYKEATGIEIGELQRLSDFDLSHKIVKTKMQERYGTNIPMDEKVISPAAMFNSDKLITIEEN
ncbi:YiiX family permuted papain-like enzyme [Aquimarina sp. Aq107]|uniref:YiiX family permuted papain-like enzyme n=1 Tax=Aquimarina sp. Aq107 TaxID=1191912 RepID=UPI000D561560|nr:YiiX family permuted papain-like enzyme [Aquimarina sp. Aq107]